MSLWRRLRDVAFEPPKDPAAAAAAAELRELRSRVERLETLVTRLQGEAPSEPKPATGLAKDRARTAAPPVLHGQPERQRHPEEARPPVDWVRLAEDWLGRVGVALLFLGLAFLYGYAVEHGWITPVLRVGFGLALGVGLLVLGLRWLDPRPRYGQVLLGGGIGVLYLTGWAAQVLYGLVPWAAGFAFMVAVTIMAFVLADHRRHEVLAVIAVAGGLATPFILESPTRSVPGLVAYAVLVLAWSGVLQVRRGWRSLMVLNGAAGFAVMTMAVALAADEADRWAAQLGVLVTWGVAVALPFAQSGGISGARARSTVARGALWTAGLGGSLVAAILTANLWDLERVAFGLLVVAFAAPFLVLGLAAMVKEAAGRAAAGVGLVLLLIGTLAAVGYPWYPAALAAEACAGLVLARRRQRPELTMVAHAAFALLALAYFQSLSQATVGVRTGPAGEHAAATLVAILLAASFATIARSADARRAYGIGAYVGFVGWLAWVLTPLPGGHGLTSAAWGTTALVVLGVGAARSSLPLRMAGLATLAAVAIKLLVIDLAALDPALRILLFLGFGGVFVVLGYLLKGRDQEDLPSESTTYSESTTGL